MNRIVTLGVYGFTEEAFFDAIVRAGIDTFCDVRLRRGVRGAAYAFANAAHLEQRLSALGIRYVHRKDLAPSREMIDEQQAADRKSHTPRRARRHLTTDFIAAYEQERLAHFDPHAFASELPEARVVCLFCVEGHPEACHRSLLAERLHQALKIPVEHIVPPDLSHPPR